MRTLQAILAAAVLIAACGAATATTITFESLSGANFDPYPGHVEGGFAVIPVSGDWREAHLFGNPVPDIFGLSDVGSVKVTDGFFTFTSVDLADAGGGTNPATFSITGSLAGSAVLNLAGTTVNTFTTFSSPDPAQILDTLVITLNKGLATYNIDNIVVNRTVPEPGIVLFLGSGLVGLSVTVARRKRHTH